MGQKSKAFLNKAPAWLKSNTNILLEAMTVLKFNKDYANYNDINFDEPLMISEKTFGKVRDVIMERVLATEENWPYTVDHMKSKWTAIRKVYNKGIRAQEKTGNGTYLPDKAEREALKFVHEYTAVKAVISRYKPSVKPPGMIDSADFEPKTNKDELPIRPAGSDRVGRKKRKVAHEDKKNVCKNLLNEIATANRLDNKK
eukprot:NODE_645_length_5051_cov_0.688409.p2 type:complete len:200 gc:universal NODE_645_length_5051_cov_0.688409:4082-4681(+)